jgi:DNA helicase II / ATP-dependent DNA helicase PcrA
MQPEMRPSQRKILEYTHGWMGISAVPGSGKTYTLSALAAKLIHEGRLQDDQEVLVVTLVNSAVDNFSRRVASFLEDDQLLPGMGYRVRTLHGLAHDIIRERPALAGLATDFAILDEHETERILQNLIQTWMKTHEDLLMSWIDPDALQRFGEYKVMKDGMPRLLQDLAGSFIRTAKDHQCTPDELKQKYARLGQSLPIVSGCLEMYADYQRALLYQNGLDFDDLIWKALEVLQSDEPLRTRLRYLWPYILEDEAQDSSRLQESILRLLAGENGNWVRVGDPNQAIFETFTTASPQYLREFVRLPGVQAHDLPESGRSARGIIRLANHLIDWVMKEHPNPVARDSLSLPYIQPVASDDPAPNPPDSLTRIVISPKIYSPDDELDKVAESVGKWVADHPDLTVAVLAQKNKHMEGLGQILTRKGVPYIELLRSTSSSRETVSRLNKVVRSITNPQKTILLADAYQTWVLLKTQTAELNENQLAANNFLKRLSIPEEWFFPIGVDPLTRDSTVFADPGMVRSIQEFREVYRVWLQAILLPVDQLLITVAQDLFTAPADLALVHKLASYLVRQGRIHPEWRLPDFVSELASFAGYQRKIKGFSEDDEGFDPKKYKGKVVLATMHKAKGLEWDKVYLTSVNNYDFPSGAPTDEFYAESRYLKGQINLVAEGLAELEYLLASEKGSLPVPGEASTAERKKLIQERLRLMYVGITRAKSELVITTNQGLNKKSLPAISLMALRQYQNEVENGSQE